MGYNVYSFSQETTGEIMEHAHKAYKHLGKMLECFEDCQKADYRENDYGEEGMRRGMRYGRRDYPHYREPWMD